MKRIISLLLLFVSITLSSQVVITMEQEGGIYKVPCIVNGLRLKFIFDTGASHVCLSETMANFMFENGYLKEDDIIGIGKSSVADGRLVDNIHVNLRVIEFAGLKLDNIDAVIVKGQKASLLLGQVVIQRLGKISISGNTLTIYSGKSEDVDYAIGWLQEKAQLKGVLSNDVSFEHFKQVLNDKNVLKDYYDYAQKYYPGFYNMSWDNFSKEIDELLLKGFCGLVPKNEMLSYKEWKLSDRGYKYMDKEQYTLAAETWEEYYNFVWNEGQIDYVDYYSTTSDGYTYSNKGDKAYKVGRCYYEAKQYEKAFEWLERSADLDNREAQFYLALMYEKGLYIKDNDCSAFYWYKKSAESGDFKAQTTLGHYYHEGFCVDEDIDEGFRWTRIAYENGSQQAARNLFVFFEDFKRLAEDGVKGAANGVALCYWYGYGAKKNDHEAFKWYKRGAEEGDIHAMNGLAMMYEKGDGIDVDEVSAAYWYKQAAEKGNIAACNNMARCYINGIGVKVDMAQGFYWAMKAAQAGDKSAQLKVGDFYYLGEGVKKDGAKALAWYKKSANQNYAPAMARIGVCYENGVGVEQNDSIAVDYYFKAYNDDKENYHYPEAAYFIAQAFEKGRGREQDATLASLWYQRAIEKEYAPAMNRLAYCYAVPARGFKRDFDEAHKYIDMAIKTEPYNSNYLDSKGEFFLMQKQYDKAREYWLRAKSLDSSFYENSNSKLNKYFTFKK